jgi:hypothetical protein
MQRFIRRTTFVPFRRFLGDVRREFMQRLSAALHGLFGSYLRDALQDGSAGMPSCSSGLGFFLFSSFCLVASFSFSSQNCFFILKMFAPPSAKPVRMCVLEQ